VKGGGKRSVRVAGRLREELAAAIRELRDPRLVGVLVSRVEVSDDLSWARVYVRHELGFEQGSDEQRRAMIKGLESASGRLRQTTARALQLRHAPSLRFSYDEAPDEIRRIEELLNEVKREGGEQS